MPFTYEFRINNKKVYGVETGFVTSRRWEEALDEAKVIFPFVKSKEPMSMFGFLQIKCYNYENKIDEPLETKSYEYLIISDKVEETTKYGYYKHNLTGIEYTSKLDVYLISSLAKSRTILDENPAPFEIYTDDDLPNPYLINQPGSSNNVYRMRAWIEPIEIKTTYLSNKEYTFKKIRKAIQATTAYSFYYNFTETDVYIETNAIPGSKTYISDNDVTWSFPKGDWYIDVGINIQPNDYTGGILGDYPIYRYYIRVVDKYSLTMYDVVQSIRQNISKYGGIESEKWFDSTRIFNIDPSIEEYLKSIEAPQIYLKDATARQMLTFVFSYINALPRLEHGGFDDLDILKIEEFSLPQGNFEIKDVIGMGGEQNTNQIGSKAYSFLEQILPNEMDKPTIYTPNQSDFQTVRTSTLMLTDDNFVLTLPENKPLYKPTDLIFHIDTVSIKFGQTNVKVFNNFELSLMSRFINIEEWELKEIAYDYPTITSFGAFESYLGLRRYKTDNIFWEMGATTINFNLVFGQVIQSTLIYNVIREQLYEYFTRNLVEPYYYTEGENTYIATDYSINATIPENVLDLKFRLEYITYENLDITHEKMDLSQIDFYSEMRVNQEESIINNIRASRKIHGDLQRTGNKNFVFQKIHTKFSDIYPVGAKDKNGYYIVNKIIEHYNNFLIVTYYVTKDHNRISQATFVDQTYRWRDNYTKNALLRHERYSDYVIVVPPENNLITNEANTKIYNNENTIKQAFNIILGNIPEDKKTEVSVALIRTDGMFNVNPETEDKKYAVSIPVSSFGMKGSLAFTFGFQKNQVVGDKIRYYEILSTTIRLKEAVRYTDENGRFTRFGFTLLKDYKYTNYDLYPLVEAESHEELFNEEKVYFYCGDFDDNIAGYDALIVDKDALTNFQMTYQMNILSYYHNLYIFGISFYSRNFLVENPSENIVVKLYLYRNGTKYEMFEDLKIKKGYYTSTVLNENNIVYDPLTNTVRFIDIDLTQVTSWAIGIDNGDGDAELLLACNENLNGFDIKVRHTRPDVYEIGKKQEIDFIRKFIELNIKLLVDVEIDFATIPGEVITADLPLYILVNMNYVMVDGIPITVEPTLLIECDLEYEYTPIYALDFESILKAGVNIQYYEGDSIPISFDILEMISVNLMYNIYNGEIETVDSQIDLEMNLEYEYTPIYKYVFEEIEIGIAVDIDYFETFSELETVDVTQELQTVLLYYKNPSYGADMNKDLFIGVILDYTVYIIPNKTTTPTIELVSCRNIGGVNVLQARIKNNDSEPVTIREGSNIVGTINGGDTQTLDIITGFTTPYSYSISITAQATGREISTPATRSGNILSCLI